MESPSKVEASRHDLARRLRLRGSLGRPCGRQFPAPPPGPAPWIATRATQFSGWPTLPRNFRLDEVSVNNFFTRFYWRRARKPHCRPRFIPVDDRGPGPVSNNFFPPAGGSAPRAHRPAGMVRELARQGAVERQAVGGEARGSHSRPFRSRRTIEAMGGGSAARTRTNRNPKGGQPHWPTEARTTRAPRSRRDRLRGMW